MANMLKGARTAAGIMKNGGYQQSPFVNKFLERLREMQNISWVTEFVFAWTVVVGFAIRYCVDYVRVKSRMERLKRSNQFHVVPITTLPQTTSRFAISTESRLEELTKLLQEKQENTNDSSGPISWSDKEVIHLVRNDSNARRLASLIMVPGNANGSKNSTDEALQHRPLVQQLQRLWPQLLQFPTHADEKRMDYPYEMSLILPVYKERIEDVHYTLMHAMKHCSQPQQVQVVVVDAGGGDASTESLSEKLLTPDETQAISWGTVQVVSFLGESGGRGGCLNYGAMNYAKGKILTFLHADTLLPANWDGLVRDALSLTNKSNGKILTHACAFGMGIDLSPRGLKGQQCRPGMVGAEHLGYLRCKLCSMPYGDSALSFRASAFHYLGGYPDQPLMEDYEIVTLLRKRAGLLKEQLVILPARARCSPRRWQTFGVVYTSLVNAVCIYRYNHGATSEELFQFYYRPQHKKTS